MAKKALTPGPSKGGQNPADGAEGARPPAPQGSGSKRKKKAALKQQSFLCSLEGFPELEVSAASEREAQVKYKGEIGKELKRHSLNVRVKKA